MKYGRRPIVSTSCNVHGQPAAAFFKDINSEIIDAAFYVVQYLHDGLKPSQG